MIVPLNDIEYQFDNRRGSSGVFDPHTSFLMQLGHLRNVRILELTGYMFPSFLAVRRFVGALPGLSVVFLTDVSWGDEQPRPTSLMQCTNWSVRTIKMWGCHSPFLGLWFWIAPPNKSAKRSRHKAAHPDSHPALDSKDAQIISDVLQTLALGHGMAASDVHGFAWEDVIFGNSCEVYPAFF